MLVDPFRTQIVGFLLVPLKTIQNGDQILRNAKITDLLGSFVCDLVLFACGVPAPKNEPMPPKKVPIQKQLLS